MSRFAGMLAVLLILLLAVPARALFHLAVIDEVMSGAAGNPNLQYVEIRMLAAGQDRVAHTRLTVFRCTANGGGHVVLINDLPADVPNGVAGGRWIMASPDAATFLAASGITPNFAWNSAVAGSIPTSCGMVCWGAPGSLPPNPPTWDASVPSNYTDCVSYGAYDGAGIPGGAAPAGATPGNGTFSLQRTDSVNFSNHFALACPNPTNNAGSSGVFGPCPPPTTTTTTLPPPICGDVNADHLVDIGDALIVAQFDVGARQCRQGTFTHPEVCDVNGDGGCNIGDALRMAQCDVGLVSCAFTCQPFSCP